MRLARIARTRQRTIGRDSGMSNAFFVPPFGEGICRTRSLRFRCSIFAFFRAVGHPTALPATPGRTQARIGKKAVGGYFSPQLSQALNILALEQNTTLQGLLGEAIDDLMRKYGKHPFGER